MRIRARCVRPPTRALRRGRSRAPTARSSRRLRRRSAAAGSSRSIIPSSSPRRRSAAPLARGRCSSPCALVMRRDGPGRRRSAVMLPIALAAAALVVLLGRRVAKARRRRSRGRARRRGGVRRGLELDGERARLPRRRRRRRRPGRLAARRHGRLPVRRDPAGHAAAATAWSSAISSAAGTFYVGASFDARRAPQRSARSLCRASLASPATRPGSRRSRPTASRSTSRPHRLRRARRRAQRPSTPRCLERLVLSDARGAAGHARRRTSCASGDARFDLAAPLEWRAIVFQEPFGQAVAIYQGTWVRQGASRGGARLAPAVDCAARPARPRRRHRRARAGPRHAPRSPPDAGVAGAAARRRSSAWPSTASSCSRSAPRSTGAAAVGAAPTHAPGPLTLGAGSARRPTRA